jgi:hypothetical protein
MTGYSIDRGAHMAVLWTIRFARQQRLQDMFRSRRCRSDLSHLLVLFPASCWSQSAHHEVH